MKKLIFIFCLFLSVSASAQRVYKVEGQPQRFVNALGIPVMPASYYNNSSDTALIFFDRNDTTTISFKLKGLVKKLAGSRLPWDSLTGVPSNFSTTYALSNDIQDSILARVSYENATRSLNMGNYRVSARGLLGDTLFARTSAGGFIATNSGAVIASFGAGGSTEIDFHGFAGQDYNRSGSFTDLSFVTKIWADSLLALRVRYTDTAAMLSPYRRTTTKITNSDLVNSTISGIALGSNLNSLTAGNGLSGTAYNGSAGQTFQVDTSVISTKANVTGLLVGYATTGSVAGKLNISDTAAMLAPFIQYSDTTGLLSNVVRTFGTQTVGGNKTFSNDIVVNNLTVGRGAGNQISNVVFGNGAFPSNSSGVFNTSIGYLSLESNTTANSNTAIGTSALNGLTTGGSNIGIGVAAGSFVFGSSFNQTATRSIYLGNGTRASLAGNSNEIVIGDTAIGNGSNTVTIGNSSVTDNYFSGNVRAGAFIRSGGTSSQFLKADGSIDSTAYGTGSVTSVSAGIGMSFTTITSTGAVNADTTTLATRAYAAGLDVGKANTSLNNVNGVLSSTYGGAGSVSGILKANGSGVVSAAVAGTDYFSPSGGTLSGDLSITKDNPKLTLNDNAGGSQNNYSINSNFGIFNLRDETAGVNVLSYGGGSFTFTGGSTFTAGVNGTSAAFSGGLNMATSSGNVGIGTTSPSEILELRNTYREPTSGEFTQVLYSTTTQDAQRGSSIGLGGTYSGTTLFTTFAGLKGGKENGDGGNTAGMMQFYTRPNGGAMTERGRISSGGRWLFGTTTDNGTDALQVAGSGLFSEGLTATRASFKKSSNSGSGSDFPRLEVENTLATQGDGTTTYNFADVRVASGNGSVQMFLATSFAAGVWEPQGRLNVVSNHPLLFFTNNTERLRIANTGAATFSSSVYAQGYRFAYAAKSSNYTLTDNDDYITVTNASTITLPTAVGRAGKRYIIRSTAGAGVTSTLATTSSQTVDGAAGPYSFGNGNYNILIVFSDGANWFSEQWITGS